MLRFLKSLLRNNAYENLTATSFLENLRNTPDAMLLDVRTPVEVAAGQLEGAVNIDFKNPNFTALIGKLDKEKAYFVYCRSGVRSANACQKMHEMGFEKLVNLAGGYLSVK